MEMKWKWKGIKMKKHLIIIMSEIIKKFDYVIPLGYVCNVTSYVMQIHKREAAYVFDRAGTSMWAVNELVKNNFEDFLNIENIIPMKLYENSETLTLTDKKYYVRIAMSINSNNNDLLKHNSDKLKHAERFMNLLNLENKTILFIRFEEPEVTEEGQRIIYDEYKEKFQKDELFYLKDFTNYIKNKNPLLNFQILFINSKENFNEEHIIGIKMDNPCNYKDPFVSKKILNTCELHKNYLEKYLRPFISNKSIIIKSKYFESSP